MNSLILTAASRAIAALMLLFSAYMLLRGHNEPGGGFIGGLIMVTAFALYAKSFGVDAARRALFLEPSHIAFAGLLLAVLAGAAGFLAGEPFLTGLWLFLGASGDDKGLPLSTVLLFDVGVYLVVVGSVLALFFELEA